MTNKFIEINAYLRNKENHQTNTLISCNKTLEKEKETRNQQKEGINEE